MHYTLAVENQPTKIYPMTVETVTMSHAAESALQNLLDASPDVICSFDTEGRFINVSAACQTVWGFASEELLGTSFTNYVHPEDYLKTMALATSVLAGNDLFDFENRWIRKDGSIVSLEWSAKWYKNKTLLCCVAKDASTRKRKEQELRISNERFKFVSMAASDVIWDKDFETGEIFYNSSASIFGVLPKSDEDPDAFWRDHLHPEDRDRVLQSQMMAIKNPKCTYWKEKYRFIKRDGVIIHVSDRVIIIRNEEGRAIRMVGAVRDITEAKKLQEAEKLSEQRYRLLFENSPFPKWIFDEETYQIVEVNKAAIEHYGYSKEEFLQMKSPDLRPPSERIKAIHIIKSIAGKENKQYCGMARHRKKNGELMEVEIHSDGLFYNNKTHIVVVINDVTERIQAHKDIAKAIIDTQEKERSIIGKELHDNVNQLLTTAKLYVQNACYYPEQKEVYCEKGAEIIQKCIDEIRCLSKELITPTLADLGFESSMQELISSYKELQQFSVDLNYQVNEQLMNKDLKLSIYRILQELLNNTVKHAEAGKVEVILHARKDYIRLIYKDDGKGFNTSRLKSGMGITNIKSRVAVHKGKVRLISSEDEGCKALIIFPTE